MSISGTSDETIEVPKPRSEAVAVPSSTLAASVSRMAKSARQERYSANVSPTTNSPNSGR